MRFLSILAVCLWVYPLAAQKKDPSSPKEPDRATLARIERSLAELRQLIDAKGDRLDPDFRSELEVYPKAVEWITRHEEWFTADSVKQTLAVLDQGFARVREASDGKTPWLQVEGKSVARGYRSRIDGSIQPYGVLYPRDYGKDPRRRWRLDLFLHGRDANLTEVKHLHQHLDRPVAPDQDSVQLNVYGRGNNAFRWAGESDVFEAMEHFLRTEAALGRGDLIDRNRIVLKGFSMGGAGTWHIGLRYPDRFAALQPGAGFSQTHGYIARLPNPLPEPEESCLRIYDAYRYAENAFMVPIVAYSGDLDAQKRAADTVERELERLGLADRMLHLVAPYQEHQFPAPWQQLAELELRSRIGEVGRSPRRERIRFVTYTLKQSRCAWIEIDGLTRHYDRAAIDASWIKNQVTVSTQGITAFTIHSTKAGFPAEIEVDQQKVSTREVQGTACRLVRQQDRWAVRVEQPGGTQMGKSPGLQGPIDDAFTGPFLCVLGTGKPLHPRIHEAAHAQYERFRTEWDRFMRGTLPVKKDTEVTPADRRDFHLILFGDPGSNSVLAECLPELSVGWSPTQIRLNARTYDAASHLPMWIQANPRQPGRYLVVNSGHTFHEADYRGTNALLYPRLGDFAIVKPAPTPREPAGCSVVEAGLFDESWKLPER